MSVGFERKILNKILYAFIEDKIQDYHVIYYPANRKEDGRKVQNARTKAMKSGSVEYNLL